MMTMVDQYLATEMFEFNALSPFSIVVFIYHQEIRPYGQGQEVTSMVKTKTE